MQSIYIDFVSRKVLCVAFLLVTTQFCDGIIFFCARRVKEIHNFVWYIFRNSFVIPSFKNIFFLGNNLVFLSTRPAKFNFSMDIGSADGLQPIFVAIAVVADEGWR